MIDDVSDPGSAEAITCADFERGYVIDRRTHHQPYLWRKRPDGTRYREFYSPPKRTLVTGITLHQTACDLGPNVERYDMIGSHYAILRDGRVLWMCDIDRTVVHGHGWNRRCIGIEVNGRYPGLLSNPLGTTWDDPTTKIREQPQDVTPEAMRSLRMLVRYLKLKTPTIAVLCSHRQSSESRQSDPGQAIWREAVALHGELGLHDGGVGFKIGDGRPNPEAWDPKAKGVRY